MKLTYRQIAMTIVRTAVCLFLFAATIGFSLFTAQAAVNWAMPLNGLTKSSGYSGFIPNRVISESSNTAAHLSQDYVSSTGQWDVMAIYGGKVIAVRNSLSDGAGRYVIIQHTIGSATVYSEYQHLLSISVSNGQSVSAGQVIGVGGQSGTTEYQYGRHLHIAIYTGVQDAWAPRLTQYAQNTVYDGPIEYAGTTYYNPDRVLHGLSVIPGTDTDPATNLRFKDVTYPKTFKIDTTNGWSLGSGIVESNYNLTSIRSEILNSSGGSVSDSGTKSISGYSYSIKLLDDYSGTNNGVRFSWISSAGNYTWRLTATDSGGRSLVMDMPFTAVSSGSTSTATMSKEYSSSIAVTGVTIDLDEVTLRENQTTTLTATVSPSNATNQSVNWSSNNTAVATVTPVNARQATVTAVKGGTAVITCTTADGSKTASCAVTVKTSVTGLTLSPTSIQINIGATSTLTATIEPSNATNKTVHWDTKNSSIATVTNGVVKGIASGTTEITAMSEDGGFTKTCTVTVTIPVTKITLSNTGLTLEKGDSATLTMTVTPSNATNKKVTWSSNNTAVATVSGGVVRAVGVGNATITCAATDGSGVKATCSVTVPEEVIPDFILPSALKEIGEEAFAGIDARRIAVPDGVKTIGKKAFADCPKLEQITIPASTTTIAKDAFANAPSSFTIHGSLNSYAQTYASENGIRFVADDACTITFNANGGLSSETSRMIKKGSAIGTLPTASKSNSTLDGWYTSASGGSKVTASSVFGGNTTVYAHWTAVTCTITFNANGGSCGTSTKVINRGEAVGTLPTPTRTYYTFKGWYTQQTGGSAVTTSTTLSQDQTLYARWEQNGFGNWSGWSTTPVSGNDNREVQTEVRNEQTGTKTTYSYSRYAYKGNTWNNVSYSTSYPDSMGWQGYWQNITLDYPLTQEPKDGYNDRYVGYYLAIPGATLDWVQSVWYLQVIGSEAVYSNVTYYRYRDRIQ